MILELFDANEQAQLAAETYHELGLISDTAQASEEFGSGMRQLHSALIINYDKYGELPEPLLEPFRPIDLSQSFTLDALRRAYGLKGARTYIMSPLWGQYNTIDLNRRTLDASSPADTAPARALLGGGDFADGLYFTGQNFDAQTQSIRARLAEHNSRTGLAMAVMNPADLIIVNAQRRLQGLPLLDNENDGTFTRVPQLGLKTMDGTECVGNVVTQNEELRLVGPCRAGSIDIGVRLSIAVPQSASH